MRGAEEKRRGARSTAVLWYTNQDPLLEQKSIQLLGSRPTLGRDQMRPMLGRDITSNQMTVMLNAGRLVAGQPGRDPGAGPVTVHRALHIR